MDRTIRVTGTGQLAVQPDTTQLLLTLTGLHEEYSDAVRHSADAAGRLKEALAKAGFEQEDLKTVNFSVNSKYESVQDSEGLYKQRFAGFEYDHRLKLEIPRDNERLGKALTAFLQSDVAVEFQIVYSVKDPRAAKNELLKNAVEDAKTKAGQLADAAGVRLGKILHIACPCEEVALRQEVMRSTRFVGETVYTAISPDLEPDDIRLKESVRVTWEIQ
ncbi:MAG: SIMPL domain-containing protein [Clostridiaceae bacterium]|nr:SIMPL domain-containing protein [Clostridiaceae bacterium]